MAANKEALRVAVDLMNYAEPDPSGMRMVLANDLLDGLHDRSSLQRAHQVLTDVLDGAMVSNGELKGVLNRASAKSWGVEYNRSFTPTEFLEELKVAIEIIFGETMTRAKPTP